MVHIVTSLKLVVTTKETEEQPQTVPDCTWGRSQLAVEPSRPHLLIDSSALSVGEVFHGL